MCSKIVNGKDKMGSIFLFIKLLGTTWTQEMVWCIMNKLNYKAAKETILEKRVPFFEYVVFNFSWIEDLK